MRQVNLRLPEPMIATVDRLRGNVPRERFLRTIVARHVEIHSGDCDYDAQAFVAESDDEDAARERRAALAYLDETRDGVPRARFAYRVMGRLAGGGLVTPPDVTEGLDRLRGEVPRERFLRALVACHAELADDPDYDPQRFVAKIEADAAERTKTQQGLAKTHQK